jgi:hypothetical protein
MLCRTGEHSAAEAKPNAGLLTGTTGGAMTIRHKDGRYGRIIAHVQKPELYEVEVSGGIELWSANEIYDRAKK